MLGWGSADTENGIIEQDHWRAQLRNHPEE